MVMAIIVKSPLIGLLTFSSFSCILSSRHSTREAVRSLRSPFFDLTVVLPLNMFNHCTRMMRNKLKQVRPCQPCCMKQHHFKCREIRAQWNCALCHQHFLSNHIRTINISRNINIVMLKFASSTMLSILQRIV